MEKVTHRYDLLVGSVIIKCHYQTTVNLTLL